MRDACNEIRRNRYKQPKKLFIPLYLESHEMCYFNILRMITLFYHLYVEHEIYAISYKKERTTPHDSLFKQRVISRSDDCITWDERLINNGY